jgi:hypothetical protein
MSKIYVCLYFIGKMMLCEPVNTHVKTLCIPVFFYQIMIHLW